MVQCTPKEYFYIYIYNLGLGEEVMSLGTVTKAGQLAKVPIPVHVADEHLQF